jgi:hypothetical protein
MEARMMLQLSWRIAGMGMALRMAAAAALDPITGMALRMLAAELKWVHLRCNYCPFVQTSVSEISTALTGAATCTSTGRGSRKYKRYILATICYIYYVYALCLLHTLYIFIN